MSDNPVVSEATDDYTNQYDFRGRTKPFPKMNTGLFAPDEKVLHEDLDKNCLYKFDDTLVCIEYPGHVKNIDKAVETLGGIEEIQKALDGKKLELTFSPMSHFMKGCVVDKEQNVGILIKVTENKETQDISYEIVGISDICFKCNRMCDFQYLPLLPKDKPENKESDVHYMHDKVILDRIPNLEWFMKKDASDNSLFLISSSFARFDQPHSRFQSNSAEAFNSMIRNDAPQVVDFSKKKEKQKAAASSVRLSLLNQLKVEIPNEPPSGLLENLRTKFLQHHMNIVSQLFEERPIWTKPGIMYKANVNHDSAKQILPCVAYYCQSGPWRTCWIKFGYNPMSDYNSRIYQVLDFRIRHAEGIQIKVKTKRTPTNSFAKDFVSTRIGNSISERNYVIKPNQVPPARQMLYQYCDILLPEIQEMIVKLPKLPSTVKFDPKNGWLPLSFQEHCREIVNRYVFDAVQQELKKESREQKVTERSENVVTYCSRMLSNIKKGFSQSIGEYSGITERQENVIEEIDLSDEEQIDANEMVDYLPERLPGSFDDEEDDGEEDSDLEIDLEAVEEVNKIVEGIKAQNMNP